MNVTILNHKTGEQTEKKHKLSKDIFDVETKDHSIYLDVKQHLANSRQGTHSAKRRAEIVGSTKKLRKQKGSGAARVGSIKSPLFRGGGTMHGPTPRDYSFKLNKKLKLTARKSALTYKAKEKAIQIVDQISFSDHKTKNAINFLASLKLNEVKTLVVMDKYDINVLLSFRNLPKAKCILAKDINTYALLDAKAIIFTPESIKSVEESFNK